MLIAAEAKRAATNVSGSSTRELNPRSNGSSLSAELRLSPMSVVTTVSSRGPVFSCFASSMGSPSLSVTVSGSL